MVFAKLSFALFDQPPPKARYSATQAALRSRSKFNKAVFAANAVLRVSSKSLKLPKKVIGDGGQVDGIQVRPHVITLVIADKPIGF